jgi:hypothetical protein
MRIDCIEGKELVDGQCQPIVKDEKDTAADDERDDDTDNGGGGGDNGGGGDTDTDTE